MFSLPYKYDSNFVEGTVLNVDITRFICSVRTTNNKVLREVRWLLPSGGHYRSNTTISPNIQDRVLISFALGYPLILGCIPRIDVATAEVISATGYSTTPDLGTDSSINGGVTANPNKPLDTVPGDFTYIAKGGARISILSGGIAILRASALSQLIMSKYEGLMRLVTRNFQRFSDASSNVSTNMHGRLYEWFGVDWNISKNRTSHERYQELYGDVSAGEILLGNPDPSLILPIVDTRVKKQWLRDINNNVIEVETLYQDGSLTFFVTNVVTSPTLPTTNTTTTQYNQWSNSGTDGTNTTSITVTPLHTVVSSVNGTNSSTVTTSPTSVVSTVINGGSSSTSTLSSSSAILSSNGHSLTVSATGIAII